MQKMKYCFTKYDVYDWENKFHILKKTKKKIITGSTNLYPDKYYKSICGLCRRISTEGPDQVNPSTPCSSSFDIDESNNVIRAVVPACWMDWPKTVVVL